jgi:hypothetical protein
MLASLDRTPPAGPDQVDQFPGPDMTISRVTAVGDAVVGVVGNAGVDEQQIEGARGGAVVQVDDVLRDGDVGVLDLQPSGGRVLEVVQLGSLCAAHRRHDLRPVVEVFLGHGEPQTAGGADQEDGGVEETSGSSSCFLLAVGVAGDRSPFAGPLDQFRGVRSGALGLGQGYGSNAGRDPQ